MKSTEKKIGFDQGAIIQINGYCRKAEGNEKYRQKSQLLVLPHPITLPTLYSLTLKSSVSTHRFGQFLPNLKWHFACENA